ncbi:MAG: fibronectin type III domain-containing protein [Actinomycetota bacterium]
MNYIFLMTMVKKFVGIPSSPIGSERFVRRGNLRLTALLAVLGVLVSMVVMAPTAGAAVADAPTEVTAVGFDRSAAVWFTASSFDGGAPITGYTVTATDSTTSANGGQTCTTTDPSAGCTVAGLTNGDSYTFTVTATNADGASAASTASTAVVPAVVTVRSTAAGSMANHSCAVLSNDTAQCWGYNSSGQLGDNTTTARRTPVAVIAAAPTLPTVASGGGGAARVSWTGSLSALTYTVTATDTTTPVNGGQTCVSSTVSCTINGLTIGDSYTFAVTAYSGFLTSAASESSSPYSVPAVTPSAPVSLVGTPGDGSASIEFTAGADGGSAITNYKYQLDGGSWVALDPTDATTPVSITGLTNGTPYSVKLLAVNSVGDGTASSAVLVTPRTVPGAPNVSSVTPGNSTVSVAFTSGATGGSLITDYEYQLNGSGSWFSLGTTSSPASIVVTNGVAYTVKLRAVNVAGSGPASDASGSFTPRTTPSAPTGLSATPGTSFASVTPGNASASIAFAPGADGGAAITKYQYRVGSGSWTDAVGTSSPITVSGLTNYANNSIRLRAVNSAGAGAASSPVSVTPRQAGPAVTSATPSGRTGIVVTFNLNPLPGTTVAYQSVVAYARGTNTVRGTCRTYAKQTTCYIGGLTRATNYDLRVTAHLPVPGKSWQNATAAGSILQVRTNN